MTGPLFKQSRPLKPLLKPLLNLSQQGYGLTPSNESAHSNSKKSRISSVFGNNKKNKSRAVAYARVSSKRQAEEGVSLDAQVERLLAYAEFRGWTSTLMTSTSMMGFLLRFTFGQDQQVGRCVKPSIKRELAMSLHSRWIDCSEMFRTVWALLMS